MRDRDRRPRRILLILKQRALLSFLLRSWSKDDTALPKDHLLQMIHSETLISEAKPRLSRAFAYAPRGRQTLISRASRLAECRPRRQCREERSR